MPHRSHALQTERQMAGHPARQPSAGHSEPASRVQLRLLNPVSRVSGPQFVAAVAGQSHRHPLASGRRYVIGRHRRGIGKRLVEMPRKLRQQVGDVGFDHALVRLGLEMTSHRPRMRELVEGLVRKTNRGRQHPPGSGARHRRDDEARVDAAGQKGAERHIADQPEPHEVFVLAGRVASARECQIPVPLDADASGFRHEEVTRRQFPDRLIDRLRRRHVLQREVRVDRGRAPLLRDLRVFEQRLDLGSKHDARRQQRVIQRLDAQPIAHEQQAPPRPVPQREREHPAEARHRALAPLFVRVNDDFRVGVRAERVAARFELHSKLGEVVDLAVEDRPDRPVFVRQRLIAGRQVDDAEPAMPEADAVGGVVPVRVRAAVGEHRRHRPQQLTLDAVCGIEVESPGDAAHVRTPAPSRGRSRARRAA